VRAHIASESVPDRKNLDIIPAPNLSCYIVAHSDQDQLQLDRKDDRSAPSLLHRPADDLQVRDELEAGAAGGGTMQHQHRGALADAPDGSQGQSRNRHGCRLAFGNGRAAAILLAREGAKVALLDAMKEWVEATIGGRHVDDRRR